MKYASAAQVVRQFLQGPLMRPALQRWRRQRFLSKEGFADYFGVFDNFGAAREWLPRSQEFNHDALATEYINIRAKQVFAYDYPMMWWLDRAFRHGCASVLDLGGSVGVHYYAYQPFMEMPSAVTWRVVEVPAIASIGSKLAAERGVRALSFTDDLQEAVHTANADIWISAGAIQYMEDVRPSELLRRCPHSPMHVLLNKLPLYDGEDFVTTQNLGDGCFAPVYVYNRDRYIQSIEAMGYVLRDEWSVHERSLYLPGHPERSFPRFTGLYFVAKS